MNLLEVKNKLEIEFTNWHFEIPPNLELGVLTTNQAFKLVKDKELREKFSIQASNPAQIAIELLPILQDFLDKNQIPLVAKEAGPYVNLDYKKNNQKPSYFSFKNKQDLLPRTKEIVLIDYFSPNVGKKMHVGHIRSADIGEVLRRILGLRYSEVISNNHLGDWGIQFGMIIWGLENIDKLDLEVDIEILKEIKNKLDEKQEFDITWEQVENYVKDLNKNQYIDVLYQIYVKVNELVEVSPDIKQATQDVIVKLDVILSTNQYSGREILKFSRIDLWYWLIIVISIFQYSFAEDYLNLNKKLENDRNIDFQKIKNRLTQINAIGAWKFNYLNHLYGFDMVIGESFYSTSKTIFQDLIESGIANKEVDSKAVYIDLEKEKLGRCYLISSQGYTLYHSRDIIARFIWAGIIEADILISLADNRQSHSFKQVFCVIQKILDSKIYEKKNFGLLSRKETDLALEKLKKRMAEYVGFGFMTLPEGAMSTRKGKIIAFEELKEKLETKVTQVLKEKEGDHLDSDLIKKVSVAALKWTDLYRDREQDVVFDFDQFLSFEGNTGIYQLYTVARLNSILDKNNYNHNLEVFETNLLNDDEILLLKYTSILPIILDQIVNSYKPHLLCTHLFELTTKINSWYSKYSVSSEQDSQRKAQMLNLVAYLKDYLWFNLELLGIEPIEKL
jgi:arginyl-tRNA synthetase